ncbi:MAG: glycosyltransferase family 4 protein [Alphaproteobacteria bacterium]|nr:glycosyltransferase family 4 protein [Alphaproteobacteria bacterium]
MTKIAYIINSLEGGGAAFPVPDVVTALRAHGADVQLFALSRRDGRAIAALDAIGLNWSVYAGAKGDHVRAFAWLNGQLRQWRPDVIWTSLTQATVMGQIAGALRGTPVISWQHNAFLRPANLRLLRATRRMSRLWVADSQSVAALSQSRLGIAARDLVTWPLFCADPMAHQALPWRPGERVRLGSLGRLHPNKGYDVLCEALVKLRSGGFQSPAPFEIVIGGEGAERERLEALIRTQGIDELRLAGFVEAGAFLASLHGYVQPSRAEGLCIAAHEAMLAGLPVIGAGIGEMPYSIVDGETGYVIAPDDVNALAGALARFLTDPAHMAAMGMAARKRVLERFSKSQFTSVAGEIMDRIALWRKSAA